MATQPENIEEARPKPGQWTNGEWTIKWCSTKSISIEGPNGQECIIAAEDFSSALSALSAAYASGRGK